MEKIEIIAERRYDKATRKFVYYYEDGGATAVTTSDTTVYSVPSGKSFYLRNLIVSNETGTGITVVIKDYNTEKLRVKVAANSSKEITNIKGIIFSTGVVASVSVGTGIVSVGGEVTE